MNEAFDWSQGKPATFPAFLTQYTLHDSTLISLNHLPNSRSVAVFDWDSAWTQAWPKSRVRFTDIPAEETHLGPHWHALLVQFARVWQIQTFNFERDPTFPEIIQDAVSQPLPHEEKLRMLEGFLDDNLESNDLKKLVLEDSLYHTVIHSIFGNRTHILHGGDTMFLCLDKHGNKVELLDI